jgi:hypothetical protein
VDKTLYINKALALSIVKGKVADFAATVAQIHSLNNDDLAKILIEIAAGLGG